MKLLELRDLLQRYLDLDSINADLEIVIFTRDPRLGPTQFVQITGGCPGFDWNKGKFQLGLSHPVIKFKD